MGSVHSTTVLIKNGVYHYTPRYEGNKIIIEPNYPFETRNFAELLRNAASDYVYILEEDELYVMVKNVIVRYDEYENRAWYDDFRAGGGYAIIAHEKEDGTISYINHFDHYDICVDAEFLEKLREDELLDFLQRGDIVEQEDSIDMSEASRSGGLKTADSLYRLLRLCGSRRSDPAFYGKKLRIVYLFRNNRWKSVYDNILYSLEHAKEM